MTAGLAMIGHALTELSTPSLVLDLDAFETNLQRMRQLTREARIALRPHGKAHRCSAIAQAQISAGAIGICCQTVGEAEHFVEGGIKDVLISNVVIDPAKLKRVASLAPRARVALCVDDLRAVPRISSAAAEAETEIEVLIEVDVGDHRLGLTDTVAIVSLAQAVIASPRLSFGGLQAYLGRAQHERSPTARRALAIGAAEAATRVRNALEAAGIPCSRITGGGTGTAEDDCNIGVMTEVQPGSYALFDGDYAQNLPGHGGSLFRQALFVLSEVVSNAVSGQVVCDAGLKAFSMESGLPSIHSRPDLRPIRVSDEHVRIACDIAQPALGERLLLIPGHCDPTVNLHDRIVGFRGERVEEVWSVDARGASA